MMWILSWGSERGRIQTSDIARSYGKPVESGVHCVRIVNTRICHWSLKCNMPIWLQVEFPTNPLIYLSPGTRAHWSIFGLAKLVYFTNRIESTEKIRKYEGRRAIADFPYFLDNSAGERKNWVNVDEHSSARKPHTTWSLTWTRTFGSRFHARLFWTPSFLTDLNVLRLSQIHSSSFQCMQCKYGNASFVPFVSNHFMAWQWQDPFAAVRFSVALAWNIGIGGRHTGKQNSPLDTRTLHLIPATK